MPGDCVQSVSDGLLALDVSPTLIARAIRLFPPSIAGVLVYGSRARGDHLASSDLDLLAVSSTPTRSTHDDSVSLSFYTEEQLSSGRGTLFGVHLARDAKILWDPEEVLARSVAQMGTLDTARLFERARRLSQVLGAQEFDLPKYLPGLLREARYLLRSCLYASAITAGEPCFSVRELAVRHGDPRLVELLASRPLGAATLSQLSECCSRLEAMLGPLPPNRHGSLEALIVNEWSTGGDLLAMALMALGGSASEADYTEIKKVLL